MKKESKLQFDSYKNLNTWDEVAVTDTWKDTFARELFIWARDNEDAYKISQFYLAKGVNNRDFNRWCETHENLETARQAAMTLIGNRREIGALNKKIDTTMVMRMMSRYDSDWKEVAEWNAQLRSEIENKSETKIIVMEQYNPPVDENRPTPESVAKKARNGMLGKNINQKKYARKK